MPVVGREPGVEHGLGELRCFLDYRKVDLAKLAAVQDCGFHRAKKGRRVLVGVGGVLAHVEAYVSHHVVLVDLAAEEDVLGNWKVTFHLRSTT